MTPGFGPIDLFNNPELRKQRKKLTSFDILNELEDIKKRYMPEGIKVMNKSDVKPKIVGPMKFTFKENELESNE